jgi:FkbM family methyltransferase
MNAINRIRAILSLLENIGSGSIKAALTWPEFSITSFNTVLRLSKEGVLPRTVLDVGANVGQFAVASAKLFPNVQVHSFEPEPESVGKLQRNVSGLGNVTVYPLALGDREGEVEFHVYSENQQSSILPFSQVRHDAFPDVRETQTIKVRISTLDRVFSDTNLHPPVLLKLDVQGYEAQTISGSAETLKRVDYAILETSFEPTYEGQLTFMDIVRLMEEHQFRFDRPVNWLAVPESGEIMEMDALFVRAV